ncbi:MAG: L,D-transpeptidase [Gammaproteobacteria bacterium]|jgi:murein L,D-transpeptidase YafK
MMRHVLFQLVHHHRPAGAWLHALLLGCCFAASSLAADRPWILIDTKNSILIVIQNDRTIAKFSGVAIGRGGVAEQRLKDDNRTPLGRFRVTTINSDSHYYRFYGLNYPTLEHALRAWKTGIIDYRIYRKISDALLNHQEPPQDTPLGGHLGIHGLGNADRRIHQTFHWTRGCIALTNEQIDALAPWIEVGTTVVIN